jgi:hypothetical protein
MHLHLKKSPPLKIITTSTFLFVPHRFLFIYIFVTSFKCILYPDHKMPYSHHSHSGSFCLHASNTLEEMIKAAIEAGMETVVLTEHMPRIKESQLYPEEVSCLTYSYRHM